MGLGGLGYFAGGLASGLQQGQRFAQNEEEQKYKREQRGREQGLRTAGANTFGNVGQQREDGSTYSDENAYEDYSKQVAGLDPERAQRAKTEGLQLRGAKRQEKYAQNEDLWFEFQQQHHMMPDEEYFPAAARFASQRVSDGKNFGVTFDANAGFQATMVDPNGSATSRPIQSRQQFDNMLQRYLSPQMMHQADAREHQQNQDRARDRAIGVTEGHYGDIRAHLERTDATMDAYRRQMAQAAVDRANQEKGDRNFGIMIGGIERDIQSLHGAMAKAETPEQQAMIGRELRHTKGRQYDALLSAGYMDKSLPRWQYVGLPDPLEFVNRAMLPGSRPTEQAARQSMEQFDQMYGSDASPSVSRARNAYAQFLAQQYSVVQPQTTAPSGAGSVWGSPPTPEVAAQRRQGLKNFLTPDQGTGRGSRGLGVYN